MIQQEQKGGIYPANKDEADKFAISIIKSLHDDKTRPQIMSQLTNTKIPIQVRIGNVVSMVITMLLSKIKSQTGRKPNIKLILKGIKMAVLDVAKMAEISGSPSTPEERKQSAGIAGQLIEDGQKQPQVPPQEQPMQQEQPMEQPQGGLIGGAV